VIFVSPQPQIIQCLPRLFHVPTSRHSRACAFIANGETGDAVRFLDDLEHAVEQAILFNDYTPARSAIRLLIANGASPSG
jgi:hypothetical protein